MGEQHTRRSAAHRDDLTGDHAVGDGGQLAFALLFGAVWIVDTFFLPRTTFLNRLVPLGIRIPLGGILLVLAAYLASKGLSIVFGEVREEPAVITKSVFGIVRHPIYLAEILVYLGLLLISLSMAAAAVWVGAIVFLHSISRYEERLLLARFGEAYADYMREVPMWLPRLWRRDG